MSDFDDHAPEGYYPHHGEPIAGTPRLAVDKYCIGIFGKLFGHKFETMSYTYSHCTRCGMPAGGWNE